LKAHFIFACLGAGMNDECLSFNPLGRQRESNLRMPVRVRLRVVRLRLCSSVKPRFNSRSCHGCVDVAALSHFQMQVCVASAHPGFWIQQMDGNWAFEFSGSVCIINGNFPCSQRFNNPPVLLLNLTCSWPLRARIARRMPVNHAAAKIDGRVNLGVGAAAVFGLNVKFTVADPHIRIESPAHWPAPIHANSRNFSFHYFKISSDRHLTAARLRRYDNSARNMNGNLLDAYGPLLLMFLAAMGISGAILAVSVLVGRRRPTRAKDQPYECGIRPTGDAREPFSVQYYLVAFLFILFDIEAIFLYPWALVYRQLRVFGFVEMLLYIIILLAGYIYLWKKGALDWNR
jgi:NADH-quinone oxidoreductase subunit A